MSTPFCLSGSGRSCSTFKLSGELEIQLTGCGSLFKTDFGAAMLHCHFHAASSRVLQFDETQAV
jgi:hypothetical protein